MKDSTKIKLQKALIVLAGIGAVGGAVALAYMEGKDNGHELGYREGFEDGKGSEGDKHSYNQGVIDTLTAHKNFIYDPWTYDKCKYYISSNVYAGETEYSDSNKMAPDFRKELEEKLGKDFHCRMVYVAKPADYDSIPHVLPPVDEEPKSIEEQPDVPAVANENGEEVG